LEKLIEAIESVAPTSVSIFCPRLSVGFLWKLIDELALYRRKKLESFNIYIARLNKDEGLLFSLNECVELQELFPKINIFYIAKAESNNYISLLPGFIFLSNEQNKCYSFESDFSLKGFSENNVISAVSEEKIKVLLDQVSDNSVCINRSNLISIQKSLEQVADSKRSTSEICKGSPDFSLSFISTRTSKIHNAGAGLNWGQPTNSRRRKDLNAAYVPVPTNLQKAEILPVVNEIFLCIFNDGIEIEMVRTGSNGKNLTSAYENQIFGRYIRFKLGVPPGQLVTQKHLESANIYGISFYKLAHQKYLIEFIRKS
jgi:hypothetical protein